MKTLRYSMAIGLLAGLGACSNMMGGSSGSSASHSTAMAQPSVAPDMVRQVQSKLRDAGYYKQGNVDGVWGAGTETAVRSFQHDHNLSGNGQLDVPTLQAMNLAGGSVNNASMNNNTNNTTPTQPMRTNMAPDNTRDNPNNPNYNPANPNNPNNTAPQAR